jgi:hypothetical protein
MIRTGTPADLDGVLDVRRQLRLDAARGAEGGFLLGSLPEVYLQLLADGRVTVLDDHGLAGFSVTLDDARVRTSELWEKRHAIATDLDAAVIEPLRIGYFDQLGVLPRARRSLHAAALALRSLAALFDDHDVVFVTTVREPVLNRAAWPYLARVGAAHIGRIDEVYPEIGALVSDVHLIPRAAFRDRLAAARRPSEVAVIRLAGL